MLGNFDTVDSVSSTIGQGVEGLCLNIGCGETTFPNFINVDCVANETVKPDLICNIKKEKLPYADNTVDQIWMLHAIEHIEMCFWEDIFREYARCLRPNGFLLLSYPEFSECARRFVNNVGNQKAFWRKTLYGRQLYPSDYHVVPMDSRELKEILETLGFYRVQFCPESKCSEYNTILRAMKDPDPITRESVIVKELGL
jgi:predicted SAM-dependent methyltransferase